MSRWSLGVVVVVLAGALLMILGFNTGGDAYQVYVPEGYVAEAERLIRDRKLVFDCRSERIDVVALAAAERTFYRHSYLEEDVDAWNDGDRRPFFVERRDLRGGGCDGRLTGVNASYHNQRLPGYVANTWRCNLFLRPNPGSTTLSGQRTLEVLPVPWPLLPLPARAFEDAWFRPGTEKTASVRSQRLALKALERGRAFATLKNVGDETVLEMVGERPVVSLDGCPVPLGWRQRLEGGDLVHFHESGWVDERYLVETGRRAGLLSFLTTVNGEPQRKTYSDRLSMAEGIAWALDAVVDGARHEAPEAVRDDFDVYLTLDPFLGHRVERALSDFCRERYPGRALRAAVTVMEPSSGRLLALASYPTAGDLDALGLRERSTRRELLRRNHNFLQHPVGSAAKPFLAAAALAVHPELASLEVRCFPGGEPPEELLGYELGGYHLPADCQGADDSGWIDLESFLTVSSNRYMLYLGLLSMADWGPAEPIQRRGSAPLPPEEHYRLGARTLSFQPRLPIVRDVGRDIRRDDRETPGDGLTELQEVEQQTELPGKFRALFDQEVHYRRERMVERLDLGPWKPVLRTAFGRDPQLGPTPRSVSAVSFAPITPERVNLRMNLIQQLRQDLYTLLLGNGTNRWSNVQLAEALARLVTGHRVEAQLVERVVIPAEDGSVESEETLWNLDDRPPPEPLPEDLPDRLRLRLLDGLRGVVEESRGTARLRGADLGAVIERINQRAPEGVRYSALAKTGTPTLPPAVVERSPTEAAPEARKAYSGRSQIESAALVLNLRRDRTSLREGEESEEVVLAFFIEAQGGSREAVALAVEVLEPLVEAYWPQDWLEVEP